MFDEQVQSEQTIRIQPTFLTPAQAAMLLQVKESTVKAWARNGDLAGAVKLGKEWRIDQKTLLEYISQKQRRPAAFNLYYAREKLTLVMHALAGRESIQHRLGAAWADANAGLTLVRYPGEFQNTADDLRGRLVSARQDSGGHEGEPLADLSDDDAVRLAHDLVSFYERIMEYQLPR